MNYRVTVSTLTPLHIGTGDVLLRDYDFVTGRDRTFVLDQEAVLAQAYEQTGEVPLKPPRQLLATLELTEASPLVRYALEGTTTVGEVREQIKDVHGRCYLPGSSLKGALRTVLMAHAVRSGALSPDAASLGPNRSWAGQVWERQAFGGDPNHDLLRALQVADSEPLPAHLSPLRLLHAQVFTGGEPSAPIWVEAIRQDMTFATQLKLDETLLLQYASQLGWGERTGWLTHLPALANRLARERCAREREAAAELGLGDAEAVCERLLRLNPGPNQFLLQLGWGAGWGAKTIGEMLPEGTLWEVRQKYELGRPPTWRGRWQPDRDDRFPRSRRLQVKRGNNADAEPGVPLGWVLVSLEPIGAASQAWTELTDRASAAIKPLLDKPLPGRPTRTAPAGPRPQPERPPVQPPEPLPVVEPPRLPARPLTFMFTGLPAVRDRFKGTVIFSEQGKLFVEIPGLPSEDRAMAIVEPADNPGRRKFKEGAQVTCEVLSLEEERGNPGYWLVKCRRE